MANRKQHLQSSQWYQQAIPEWGSLARNTYSITYVEPSKLMLNAPTPGQALCPDEESETTQAYSPYSTNVSPWDGMVSSNNVNPYFGFPLKDVEPILRHDGENASSLPSLQSNILSTENAPSSQFSASVGPAPNGTPKTDFQGQIQSTSQGPKHRCTTCQKTFDRASRLDNCRNGHSSLKPYRCLGACGRLECPALYASSEKLKRHVNRHVLCPSCGKGGLKQNMARHKACCRGGQ